MPNFCSLCIYFLLPSLQNNDGSEKISGEQLKDLYKSFVSEYPIVSIEDPFDQDDWEHYGKMTAECGVQVQIVGDDLLVTNPKVRSLSHCHFQSPLVPPNAYQFFSNSSFCFHAQRVEKAIKEKTCNALLLKVIY